MTVTSTQSSITLLGNGATTVFSFPFIGVSAADIAVIYTDPNGNTSTIAPANYVVNLNAPIPPALWGIGGTVTYNPPAGPIPNGSQLSIVRQVPETQLVSFANQGASYPQTVETAVDLLCMMIQQNLGEILNCFQVPPTDPAPAFVPPVAVRKSSQALWDVNGNLTSGLPIGNVTVSTAMVPVVTAGTIAAALAVMGIPSFQNALNLVTVTNSGNDYTGALLTGSAPVSSYTDKMLVSFTLNATPGGNIRFQIGSVGLKNVYWGDGTTQVGTDVALGEQFTAAYNASLNSAAGGWQIIGRQGYVTPDVTAGAYTSANITVDKFGRITAVASGAGGSGFPSGTLMLFQQTAAPTGWTKGVTFNDYAIRITTGTASSGGTTAFSTVFGQTATGSTTLTTSQVPSGTYTHKVNSGGGTVSGNNTTGNVLANAAQAGCAPGNMWTSNATNVNNLGSIVDGNTGGAHNHGITLTVNYVDCIIASKN